MSKTPSFKRGVGQRDEDLDPVGAWYRAAALVRDLQSLIDAVKRGRAPTTEELDDCVDSSLRLVVLYRRLWVEASEGGEF